MIKIVKGVADELKESNSSKQIERVLATMTSGKVQMGLVGLTNSGKSTSLNALMGLDILPSSFQRQTVSTVCIKHNPRSPGELYGRKMSAETSVLLASGLKNVRAYVSQLNDHDRTNSIFYSELVLQAPICCLVGKDKVDLEIYDTPGTSEAGSNNVSTAWNLALNNLAAIVLIISADSLFDVSQDSLLEKIKSLHPHMMEKQNRMLVLVNQYDKCFDGNKESWTPAQLHEKVAKHVKVSPEQVVLFSARWALEARKWMKEPSTVSEDAYGEAYFFLRRTPEKDAIESLKPPHTRESVMKLGEVLERFSRIQDVETRLLGKLCVNGPGILLESAVDDSLRELSKLKVATEQKVQAVNIVTKRDNVTQQKGLVKKVDQVIEKHCKQKISTNLPRLVMQDFELQLNAITSALENKIVSGATGKVISLRGEFTDRNQIFQRVITVRNDMVSISEGKVAEAWSGGLVEMKSRLAAQLRQLMQELKQDIFTAHLSNYLNFDGVNASSLVDGLSLPAVQQPSFSQCQAVNDASINSLVVARTVTKQRVENRTKKGGRMHLGIVGPRETIHYTVVVDYQETVYEVNIDGLNGAFQKLAAFSVTHVRSSLVRVLGELANKLSQSLWGDIQQLSKQPLWKLQHELEARMQALELGDEEIKMLLEKGEQLTKAENELRKLL